MNNTRTLAIAAILIAAALVVGVTLAATTPTQSAFAYSKNRGGGDENSRNGNTITIQKCKQAATQSGFDNIQNQDCKNTICTHPGESATCVQEAAIVAQAQVKLTCEQCFTKFLNSTQISALLRVTDSTTLGELCALLSTVSATEFILILEEEFGVSESAAIQLVQCLLDAGVVFGTERDMITTR